MRVGCPKEIKNHEYRVGLTPAAVREYVAHGHDVLIETGAGAGIDAVLIATDHDAVDYAALLALGCPVVDTRNAIAARGLPMERVTKA